jgi:hypothetical protein
MAIVGAGNRLLQEPQPNRRRSGTGFTTFRKAILSGVTSCMPFTCHIIQVLAYVRIDPRTCTLLMTKPPGALHRSDISVRHTRKTYPFLMAKALEALPQASSDPAQIPQNHCICKDILE